MHAIASLCCATGAVRRYELIGDGTARLTHEAVPIGWGGGYEWQSGIIEEFRANPDPGFAITERPLLKQEHDAPWRCDPLDVA